MYIIELIAKLIQNKNKNKSKPLQQGETENLEMCEHTFFPIDSTKETLACSKCGLIVKNDPKKYKPKNPFN